MFVGGSTYCCHRQKKGRRNKNGGDEVATVEVKLRRLVEKQKSVLPFLVLRVLIVVGACVLFPLSSSSRRVSFVCLFLCSCSCSCLLLCLLLCLTQKLQKEVSDLKRQVKIWKKKAKEMPVGIAGCGPGGGFFNNLFLSC